MKNFVSTVVMAAIFIAPSVSRAIPLVANPPRQAQASDASPDTIKSAIRARYAEIPVTDVLATPMAGVFEVDIGREIAYTDASASTFIFGGHMVNMAQHADLTQIRMNEINHIDFQSLPLDQSIKITSGSGLHRFAVFSDPLCPYCRQMEKMLRDATDLTDYTEYVFPYPIDQLHPGSSVLAQSIWCAKDPATTWRSVVGRDAGHTAPAVQKKTCVNPIAKNQALGEKLGISGTPTLVNESGVVVPGAMDRADFEKFLLGTAKTDGKITNGGK